MDQAPWGVVFMGTLFHFLKEGLALSQVDLKVHWSSHEAFLSHVTFK